MHHLSLVCVLVGCANLVGIEGSTELSLATLEVTGGTLVPAFDPDVHAYEMSLTYRSDAIELAARAGDPSITVTISSTPTPQGVFREIAVPIGDSTIEVTARTTSGVESVYTITARRSDFVLELAPAPSANVIGMAMHVQAADVDGDGSPDLIYGGYTSGAGVALNDGTGRFSSGWHQTFASARSFLVANVIGAPAPDLIVADGSLVLLEGHGDGTFGTPYPRGFSDASALAAGQLDTDGRDDLVVADGPGRVSTLFGDSGMMVMGPSWQPSAVQYEPRTLALGRVDGTPGIDVVQLDGTANTIVVSPMNNPANSYALLLPAAATPRELVVADLDQDARDEVIWIDPIVGVLNIQQATAAMTRTPISLGGWAFGLAVGDLDGDGWLDLVTVQNDTLVVLHNDMHGHLAAIRYPGIAAGASSIAIADLDGDGDGDVIIARSTSMVSIFKAVVP